MKRLLAALACACLAFSPAGADARAVTFGVTEDMVKRSRPRSTAQLADLGMSENAISVLWNPDVPTALPPDAAAIDEVLRVAAQHGSGSRSRSTSTGRSASRARASPILMAQFATWLQTMARRFPTVKEFIAPNEPNQPRFWRPQFDNACQNIAGAAYARVMATMYDAVKSVNPQIEVAGAALSPRGNDNCLAPNNVSTSPVRFLKYLGDEYRRMKRNRPLMDSFSFHPYPRINTDDPMTGYPGRTSASRTSTGSSRRFTTRSRAPRSRRSRRGSRSASTRWATRRRPRASPATAARRRCRRSTRPTQARYYTQLIRFFACDPAVDSINVFHLVDESDLGGLQSGMVRVDGSRKPSYAAVKEAIAEANAKGCTGKPVRWAPSTAVTGANVEFGLLGRGTLERAALDRGAGDLRRGSLPRAARLNGAGRIAIARSLASAARDRRRPRHDAGHGARVLQDEGPDAGAARPGQLRLRAPPDVLGEPGPDECLRQLAVSRRQRLEDPVRWGEPMVPPMPPSFSARRGCSLCASRAGKLPFGGEIARLPEGGLVRTRCADGERRRTWATPRIRSSSVFDAQRANPPDGHVTTGFRYGAATGTRTPKTAVLGAAHAATVAVSAARPNNHRLGDARPRRRRAACLPERPTQHPPRRAAKEGARGGTLVPPRTLDTNTRSQYRTNTCSRA